MGPDAHERSRETLAAMVELPEPGWELREATPAERGFCSVYRVLVARNGATRELYVKASPDGHHWDIPTEARVQAVLDRHTSIPVPAVLGVADDHDALPTPFYLLSALPGEHAAYERVGRLDDDVLARLARDVGRYLGELHAVPAVDGFGPLRPAGPSLTGGRPEGDLGEVTAEDPDQGWETYLREYVERELERLEDSRFSALAPELTRWVEAAVDDLSGPFEPVLGRNDHGLHNLLLDPETGAVTAMLDWGYTLAVTPVFDVEFAIYLFGGAFLAGLPDVSDRRRLVREALLAGYAATESDHVQAVSTPEPLYELLAMVRIMNDFERLEVPDGTEPAVMDAIESDVEGIVGR